MPRKSQKSRKKAAGAKAAPAQTQAPEPVSRRGVLAKFGWYGAGAVVLGGGGMAFALDFRSKLAEADLSRIGQGMPTIVQIHDPQCGQCAALQAETRAALSEFEDGQITYLVANIRSTEGAAFAARMGLPHVTLVLFDPAGQPVSTVQGVTPRDQLSATFRSTFQIAAN